MNKDNYKNAMNQIHASQKLKNKTLEKIEEKENKGIQWSRLIPTVCTLCVVMFFVTTFYLKNNPMIEIGKEENEKKDEIIVAQKDNLELARFENMEQLKKVLKKTNNYKYSTNDTTVADAITADTAQEEGSNSKQESTNSENKDYSTTNVQVEGVDEADVVKTDGDYIYYVTDGDVFIINAKDLKITSKLQYDEENKSIFRPRELYINGEKLIVLGDYTEYNQIKDNDTQKRSDYIGVSSKYYAKAIVYDVSNKEKPSKLREVALDGSYSNSRMIGENIYLISSKYVYYYNDMNDSDILPILKDSVAVGEKKIACTDIAYFGDTDNSNFMMVAGFNINDNKEAEVETFFGANDTVYASKENLYITQTDYSNSFLGNGNYKSKIYKFKLENSSVKLLCKGEVKGDLNDQFSMDEYDGNLRIATTSGYSEKTLKNQLYILDENLNQIGSLTNLAKGEEIYSVRFIGKIGYVVTFKEVDPLFVIDLSDPTNPVVKGKLKIPGYSSYLHPYDETHIIGIGYNTKSNGYGGVTNDNMKMSMFDVSDLENPKELFSVNIGDKYVYSEITRNHKALFYNKDKNLIGFPISSDGKAGFVIYKIDLSKGFEKYGQITKGYSEGSYSVERIIYIDDILYVLTYKNVFSYNLTNLESISELDLDE